MGNIDCKVECGHCKEVFIVSSMTHPLPVHNHLGVQCRVLASRANFFQFTKKSNVTQGVRVYLPPDSLKQTGYYQLQHDRIPGIHGFLST